MSGKGTTSAASGAFRDAGLSWKARTEGAAAATTPEELLAAAHASCFSMALSHALAQGGHPATRLETSCVVEFGPKRGGGFEVKSSALEVKGWVPGIDAGRLREGGRGREERLSHLVGPEDPDVGEGGAAGVGPRGGLHTS